MFHLFAWGKWEASGGVHDYIGAYDSIDAAKAWFSNDALTNIDSADHGQIVIVGDDGRLKLVSECDRSLFVNQRHLAPWDDYE